MSEEPLERSQEAIDEAKQAAAAAPVMPFDDAASPEGRTPETPEQSGGAVAEHGDEDAGAADTFESGGAEASSDEGGSGGASGERGGDSGP